MSDEKIKRLERIADDHGNKIGKLETGHAVNDERHKRADNRIFNLENNWSWLIKLVAAIIITGMVTAYISGGFVK